MTIHHNTAHKERGAAHLVFVLVFVIGLIGVLGFLGFNAWQKQAANAGGTATVARVRPYVKVINTGDGAQPDIIVRPGQTKNTGYDVNQLTVTRSVGFFSFSGTPNSSYKGSDIYREPYGGGTYGGSERYNVLDPSDRVGFSSSGSGYSGTHNLCYGYSRVTFSGIGAFYVKQCTLNNTQVKVGN